MNSWMPRLKAVVSLRISLFLTLTLTLTSLIAIRKSDAQSGLYVSTVAGDGEADASPSMDAMARSATLVCRTLTCRLLTIVGSSLAMACGCLAASAADSAPLPAAVQVAAEHAYLRAGPGDDFYPKIGRAHV